MMVPPPHPHTNQAPSQVPKYPPIPLSSAIPFYHSTPSCICQSLNLQKWLQCLIPTSLLTAPPTRTTFSPILRHCPQDHPRLQPPSFQALCLHPSSLSPSLPAPCPCLPHTPLPPAFPGPWPHLPSDHLALFSLLVALLLPCSRLLSRELLWFRSSQKKAHMGTGMCREMKRQQLLRQQARRGPLRGGILGTTGA